MISKYRDEIDILDKEIIELYKKRLELSKKIGIYKIENNISVLNKEREEEVISKNIKDINDENLVIYVKNILQFIMKESRNFQKNIKF
ncbi:MAG: chorismate mutase [Peptostreptococcaceae bacterium]